MNYELAKKLKEAGFEQKLDFLMSADDVNPNNAIHRYDHRTFDLSVLGYPESAPDYYEQGKWRASCIMSKKYLESETGKKETLLFPTLEELIEACPDKLEPKEKRLGLMAHFTLTGKRGDYIAFYQTPLAHEEPIGEGSTPSEAVAMLYLKLHEK